MTSCEIKSFEEEHLKDAAKLFVECYLLYASAVRDWFVFYIS